VDGSDELPDLNLGASGPSCPPCGHHKSSTKDSRPYRAERTWVTRRRRLCMECGQRFTTYESTARYTKLPPQVKRQMNELLVALTTLLASPEIQDE